MQVTVLLPCDCAMLLLFLINYFGCRSPEFETRNTRCCPSSLANIMRKCWDASLDKRPEMDEVVSMLEAIDTSRGGGMIPIDQQQGCFCFRKH
ncbi:hypothetical protein P8452_77058 [Trifolium repens]|nr:hypothetical protein P8452_77058 [Trifolium repens]